MFYITTWPDSRKTLFYSVLIFFIYGNYHAKIEEKILFLFS